MRKEDKKIYVEHENKKNKPASDLDEDMFIFVPAESIRAIDRVIQNWEEVMREWSKVIIVSDNTI